jgi:hypothetical protein
LTPLTEKNRLWAYNPALSAIIGVLRHSGELGTADLTWAHYADHCFTFLGFWHFPCRLTPLGRRARFAASAAHHFGW